MAISATNDSAYVFIEADDKYPQQEATRYAGIVKALQDRVVAFDTPSSQLRAKIPALAAVETAEIEREMGAVIALELSKPTPCTAVVFNQQRRIVFTIELVSGGSPNRNMKVVCAAVEAGNYADRKSDLEFEILLMPRGTYGSNPMLVHRRGIPFGTMEVSSRGKVSGQLGIEREIEIEYRPEQQPMLGKRLYKSDNTLGSRREISRQLDWLAAHLCWCRDFEPSICTHQRHDTGCSSGLETREPAKEQSLDEISVRIFSLAAKLVDCDPSLVTENERSAAHRCASLDPANYPFLSEGVVVGWKKYASVLTNNLKPGFLDLEWSCP